MTDNITVARIRKYSAGIDLLAQQKHSRLRDKVRVETDVKAKMTLWDQMEAIDLEDKLSRHQKTPTMDVPHLRRALFCKIRHGGVLVDEADLSDIMTDPTSQYGELLARAAGRKTDQVIIDAADGTAKTGEEGDTPVDMLTGNIILHNNTGMTQVKIQAAKKILDQHEVDELIPRCAVASAQQFDDLFSIAALTTVDSNTIKALVQGEIDTWVGFNWLRSELLNSGTAPNDRKCLFYAMDGILLGVKGDLRARVGERPDLSYDGQVYVDINIGATRMEEKKVVVVQCDEP